MAQAHVRATHTSFDLNECVAGMRGEVNTALHHPPQFCCHLCKSMLKLCAINS